MITQPEDKLAYPPSPMGDVVESIHGIRIQDPYRWLEDLELEQTRSWVAAQRALSNQYLSALPSRDRLAERLAEIWSYELISSPQQKGGRLFALRQLSGQRQPVLAMRESSDADWKTILDPNPLSADGTVAISNYSCSDDGKKVAYGLASAGSDWTEWHVRDIETGRDLPDCLTRMKFTNIQWTEDGKGFYYAAYVTGQSESFFEANTQNQKLYFHSLGAAQKEDQVIYERLEEEGWFFMAVQTHDHQYTVITGSRGTGENKAILYRPANGGNWTEIVPPEAYCGFIGNIGPVFYVLTEKDAPKKRIIAIDTRKPEQENWITVIPEGKDTIADAKMIGSDILVSYLKDAHSLLRHYNVKGELLNEPTLQTMGQVWGLTADHEGEKVLFLFESFLEPLSVWSYDIKTRKASVIHKPDLAFDASGYETEQVFYPSKDGTKIPMFLVHKKGLKPTGETPTLLYGYGGFSVSKPPFFLPRIVEWLEMGGLFAMANLRGGGEYGKEWYDAGRLHNKQNVFDDFIAAAEWLIANNYTNSKKLAINGRSNGGLLVGAVLNQRPDLFGAAAPEVGVMDMLRYDKFTVGSYWAWDYGLSSVEKDFKVQLLYSPLHNVHETKYPPTLIMTADHDDRVAPAHSYKFAAAMQHAQVGDAPILIRIESAAGHGMGKPLDKQIEESADLLAFLVKHLGMKLSD